MNKKLRVTVDGKSYEVEVEILEQSSPAASPAPSAPAAAPAAASPAPMSAPAAKAAAPAGPGQITSPLAGRVVGVGTKVGDAVKEGDQLLTLEAMKMNTFIFADRDGKIAEIMVKEGDAVEEGQALIRIE